MKIEKTEELLSRFNYKFRTRNNKIEIELELSQKIIVDYSQTSKIIITEKLESWNFLTGIFEMNLKSAIIYNLIMEVILAILLFVLIDENLTRSIGIFLLSNMYFIFWTIFYWKRAENLKLLIMSWNEN